MSLPDGRAPHYNAILRYLEMQTTTSRRSVEAHLTTVDRKQRRDELPDTEISHLY